MSALGALTLLAALCTLSRSAGEWDRAPKARVGEGGADAG
jgi:hypothetical protein